MSTSATVKLWGSDIGYVTLADGEQVASFEYDPAFIRSGIELSPLHMPLSNRVYWIINADSRCAGTISPRRSDEQAVSTMRKEPIERQSICKAS